MVGRGSLLGHVDLCDDASYFHGKPLLTFSAKTTTPVVVIAFPQLVFLELRESNERFAAYIEREITQRALQASFPFQGVSIQQPQAHDASTKLELCGRPDYVAGQLVQSDHQVVNGCGALPAPVPRAPIGLDSHPPPTRRRRRRSVTGLQVANGRVVLAQPATDGAYKQPRDVTSTVFRSPLAAEAPF